MRPGSKVSIVSCGPGSVIVSLRSVTAPLRANSRPSERCTMTARRFGIMLSAALMAGCGSGPIPYNAVANTIPTSFGSSNSPTQLGALSPERFGAFYKDARPGGYPIGQIVLGPDKNLWFADTTSIGRITPSGVQTKFAPNAAGGIIATGPSQALWFTSYDALGNPAISRITTNGSVKNFPISFGLAVMALAWGPDNNEWFVENGRDSVGKITPSGKVTSYPLPDAQSHMPVGISQGPDGNVWFVAVDFYGHSPEVGRVTPGGTITEYSLPSSCTLDSDSIVLGSDQKLWTSAYCLGYAMVSVTTSGTASIYPVAHPMSEMMIGFDHQIWGSFQRYITEFNTTTHVQGRPIQIPLIGGRSTYPWALTPSSNGDMWLTVNIYSGSSYIGAYHGSNGR
jgi:virginiamycin B lyase